MLVLVVALAVLGGVGAVVFLAGQDDEESRIVSEGGTTTATSDGTATTSAGATTVPTPDGTEPGGASGTTDGGEGVPVIADAGVEQLVLRHSGTDDDGPFVVTFLAPLDDLRDAADGTTDISESVSVQVERP